METAANEPCYRRGIVFPLAHCFPALLIVPRLAPRPSTNCTGPKNNAARNYFSIDARRHHHHHHHPRHVEAGMVIARAGASPGLKRIQGGGGGGGELKLSRLLSILWMDGNVEWMSARCAFEVIFLFFSFNFSFCPFLIPTISRKLLTWETIIPFFSKRGQRRKVPKG